jgi:hypothetical protein
MHHGRSSLCGATEQEVLVMTAMTQPESKPPSRRALLAGALGGLGALAASVVGRANPVRAADDDPVLVGGDYTSTSVTHIQNTTNTADVLLGESIYGTGVYGISALSYGVRANSNAGDAMYGASSGGTGVLGTSNTSYGVHAVSNQGTGLYAEASGGPAVDCFSSAQNSPAAMAWSGGNNSGVYGCSGNTHPSGKPKTGVYGFAAQDTGSFGVVGESSAGVGVCGRSTGISQPALLGQSTGHGTGVLGFSSGGGSQPAAKAKTGVYGYAAQDGGSFGVVGESPDGIGVYGASGTSFGGFFAGKVYTTKWYELGEVATPPAPAANKARLFVRDNGAGKTQLCVRFATGTVKVLATEG